MCCEKFTDGRTAGDQISSPELSSSGELKTIGVIYSLCRLSLKYIIQHKYCVQNIGQVTLTQSILYPWYAAFWPFQGEIIITSLANEFAQFIYSNLISCFKSWNAMLTCITIIIKFSQLNYEVVTLRSLW